MDYPLVSRALHHRPQSPFSPTAQKKQLAPVAVNSRNTPTRRRAATPTRFGGGGGGHFRVLNNPTHVIDDQPILSPPSIAASSTYGYSSSSPVPAGFPRSASTLIAGGGGGYVPVTSKPANAILLPAAAQQQLQQQQQARGAGSAAGSRSASTTTATHCTCGGWSRQQSLLNALGESQLHYTHLEYKSKLQHEKDELQKKELEREVHSLNREVFRLSPQGNNHDTSPINSSVKMNPSALVMKDSLVIQEVAIQRQQQHQQQQQQQQEHLQIQNQQQQIMQDRKSLFGNPNNSNNNDPNSYSPPKPQQRNSSSSSSSSPHNQQQLGFTEAPAPLGVKTQETRVLKSAAAVSGGSGFQEQNNNNQQQEFHSEVVQSSPSRKLVRKLAKDHNEDKHAETTLQDIQIAAAHHGYDASLIATQSMSNFGGISEEEKEKIRSEAEFLAELRAAAMFQQNEFAWMEQLQQMQDEKDRLHNQLQSAGLRLPNTFEEPNY